MLVVVHTANSQVVLDIKFNSIEIGKAFLLNATTNQFDSIYIKNGHLLFNTTVNDPTLYSLFIQGYNDYRPMRFILSDETTEVEFDTLKKVLENQNIKDFYPNQPSFIKDPNSNQVFYDFHSEWMMFYDNIMELSTTESNELLEKRKEVYHSFLGQCESIIRNNYDKFVSAVIIDFLLRENLLPLEYIQKYYDYLDSHVKDSYFGMKIGEYAGKTGKSSLGNPATEFELYDIYNQKYDLENLKGKKILLHFWSSSCAPCIKEAPDLIRLSEENEDELVTINISLDTDIDKWKKGIERAAIGKMNNVCDFKGFKSQIAQDYAVNVVPTYYLIDEKGIIIMKGSLNQVIEIIK